MGLVADPCFDLLGLAVSAVLRTAASFDLDELERFVLDGRESRLAVDIDRCWDNLGEARDIVDSVLVLDSVVVERRWGDSSEGFH